MQIAMNIDGADISRAFRSYVERRLRFALGRFGGRVGQITVHVCGNGSGESRCRISTEILRFGHVAVEESDPDLFIAIDRATGRIGRVFGRELQRSHDARVGRESIRLAA